MPSVWDDATIIEIPLPTCPGCGSPKYIPIRGKKDSDGGCTSRRICKVCSERYIVLRLPDCGNDGIDDS
jgi:hypothetical protein